MNRKLKFIYDNFEEIILSLFFINMCVFVSIQIVSRYVFRSPLIFTDEISRYSYVWICFFGMGAATKLENHIRIELVQMLVKGKVRAVIELLVNLVSLALYGILAVMGYQYTTFNYIQLSPAMEISKAFVYASLPLGAFFSILRLLYIIKRDYNTLRTL